MGRGGTGSDWKNGAIYTTKTIRRPNTRLEILTYSSRGRHLSYQRGKRTTTPGTSLIKIEGVENTEGANFYLGKKVAFVYRAGKEIRGSKIRVIWGKITRPHGTCRKSRIRQAYGGHRGLISNTGNSGVVRAQFRRNLPPKSFGASVRVMLYPSSI